MPINRHAVHVIEQAVAQVASARATRAALILDARTAFVLTALCDRLVRTIRIEAPDKLPTREPRPQLHRVVTPPRRHVVAPVLPAPYPVPHHWQRVGEWDKGGSTPAALDRFLFLRGLSLPKEALVATVFQDQQGRAYAVCQTRPRTPPVVYEAIPYPARCGTIAVASFRWVQAVTLISRAVLPPAA